MSHQTKVQNFWEKLGKSKPPGELVTHRDIDQVAVEIDTISSFLNENDILLDIGCGNGFSTFLYAKTCKKAVGIDYAETMIESANKHYQREKLKFAQQDVLTLNKHFGQFSVIVSTRCLINLASWDEQKQALRRIHSCLLPNGRLILAEGSKQGRKALNELRMSVGLNSMPPVWHNIDLDEDLLIPFLDDFFEIEEDIRFGLYDVLTRVYYPMTIAPQDPQYGTPFHNAARGLMKTLARDRYKQYGREFILVLRKR
jgi:SAM-dependent methyltransferase